MKKILILIILIICPYVNAISAQNYIVYDMQSKRILMGSNITSPRLIASTTKIMTGIIAIEKGNLNDIVEINKEVLKTTGSSIYLSLGEKISLKDLIYGMMLRSGNDAAIAVAQHISGSMEDFAKLMNEYAKNIGMNSSSFINSTGLEESSGLGNISSAFDMALLTAYAMKNDVFKNIFKAKEYVGQSNIKKYHWENKNKLLKYDYITGGKTGYTRKAKRTLVTTGKINEREIVIVTLNDPDDWLDHKDIYNTLKENYFNKILIDKDNLNILEDGINVEKCFYTKSSFSYGLFKDDKYEVKYTLYDDYDESKDVGNVIITVNNEEVYKDNIYVRVKKESFWKRLFNKIFNFKR